MNSLANDHKRTLLAYVRWSQRSLWVKSFETNYLERTIRLDLDRLRWIWWHFQENVVQYLCLKFGLRRGVIVIVIIALINTKWPGTKDWSGKSLFKDYIENTWQLHVCRRQQITKITECWHSPPTKLQWVGERKNCEWNTECCSGHSV